MPKDYDNTDRGFLYINEDKLKDGGSEKWPDSKGSLNVNGVDYWLSAWRKVDKNGVNYLSVAVQRKQSRRQHAEKAQPKAPVQAELNDDIPF